MIPNNENNQLCSECGGKCCTLMPGCAHPSDFKITKRTPGAKVISILTELLRSKDWQVDCWDNYAEEFNCKSEGYFIRPATLETRGKLFHRSWGMEGCAFRTDQKCRLEFKQRPYDCRNLKPSPDFPHCGVEHEHGNQKLHATHLWIPYEEQIEAAMNVIRENP